MHGRRRLAGRLGDASALEPGTSDAIIVSSGFSADRNQRLATCCIRMKSRCKHATLAARSRISGLTGAPVPVSKFSTAHGPYPDAAHRRFSAGTAHLFRVRSRNAACALQQSFEVAGEDFVTEVERDAGSDCNRMSDVCGRVSRFTSRRTLTRRKQALAVLLFESRREQPVGARERPSDQVGLRIP